jgi:hypothetical protein
LIDTPSSEYYVPTFPNTVSSILIGGVGSAFLTPPMKMKLTVFRNVGTKIQTPGTHPPKKEYNIQNTAKVLKSRRKICGKNGYATSL